MAESPTGVIPEKLMNAGARSEVLEFLKRLPVPGIYKRDLLRGWARVVNVKLNAEEFNAIERSSPN